MKLEPCTIELLNCYKDKLDMDMRLIFGLLAVFSMRYSQVRYCSKVKMKPCS